MDESICWSPAARALRLPRLPRIYKHDVIECGHRGDAGVLGLNLAYAWDYLDGLGASHTGSIFGGFERHIISDTGLTGS